VQKCVLDVFEREDSKSSAKIARRLGFIPAVAYHRGDEPKRVKISYKEFVRIGSQVRSSQVFTLKSNVSGLDGKSAIVKEVQMDHLANRVLHIDLQTLKENEVIQVEIPVRIVGESPGVKNDGGILSIAAHEVSVRCLPKNIPEGLDIDISALNVGQSIHAKDLVLPENVELVTDVDETLVSVVAVRQTEVESPVGAAAADAGAAAPAAAAQAAAKTPAKGGK
jgi:large subunit ribosomal protein L25